MSKSIGEQFKPSETSDLAGGADRLQTQTIPQFRMVIRKPLLMDLLDFSFIGYCHQSGSMNTDNA